MFFLRSRFRPVFANFVFPWSESGIKYGFKGVEFFGQLTDFGADPSDGFDNVLMLLNSICMALVPLIPLFAQSSGNSSPALRGDDPGVSFFTPAVAGKIH